MMKTSPELDATIGLPCWANDSFSDQEDDFADDTLAATQSQSNSLDIFQDSFLLPPVAEDTESQSASNVGPDGRRKARRPPNTAERRATHNAVERARRESLNGRFMELAAALPTMSSVKRPSKSMIVNKSLEFVFGAEDREKRLREENAALKREVDELRMQLGLTPKNLSPASPNPMNGNMTVTKRISISSQNSQHTDDSFSAGQMSCSPASTVNSFFTSSPKESGTPPSHQQAQVSPVNLGEVKLPRMQPNLASTPVEHQNQPRVASQQALAYKNVQAHNMLSSSLSAAFPFAGGVQTPVPQVPYLDVNYFMQLGMQGQQQQQIHQQQQLQAQAQQMHNTGLALNLTSVLPNWNQYYLNVPTSHPASLPPPTYAFA